MDEPSSPPSTLFFPGFGFVLEACPVRGHKSSYPFSAFTRSWKLRTPCIEGPPRISKQGGPFLAAWCTISRSPSLRRFSLLLLLLLFSPLLSRPRKCARKDYQCRASRGRRCAAGGEGDEGRCLRTWMEPKACLSLARLPHQDKFRRVRDYI